MATIRRKAEAQWSGSGKEGRGTLTTASGTLTSTPYSFTARFENGIGTNPEELIPPPMRDVSPWRSHSA
jgi:osmotically inducible protein OsmC